MKTAALFLVWFLFYFSLVSLVVGLIRPVLVLWFLDRMNRHKVLMIYGTSSLLFFIILAIFEILFHL